MSQQTRLSNYSDDLKAIDANLNNVLSYKSNGPRFNDFLGKIYAVQDMAIERNDNPVVNEIVEALIALE